VELGPDPDVFAYWDSTQANVLSPTRLNFSEYKSTTADKALEAGRTRSDPAVRAIKYKSFISAWRSDVPAIALYQPKFLYVTRGPIYNFSPEAINEAADRFNNVVNWEVREQKQTIQ
jgi:ABC-type transport system substrate-binding protein